MKHILTSFAGNKVFATIVLAMILLTGFLATLFMVKEDLPEMAEDSISVSISYPGADPEEVEEGICRKIETAIHGAEGIKSYMTQAMEDVGTASIVVKTGYDPEQVLDRIRSIINAISTFPPGAERPIITRPVHRTSVMILYLQGDMPERRLKEWANRIKDDMGLDLGLSHVEIVGTRPYEISIEISEEKLRQFGLTISQVADAIRKSSLSLAGGVIQSQGQDIRIRTTEKKYTGKELASVVVLTRPEGEIITLDRIANIRDGFEENVLKTSINGRPGVLLNVYKSPKEDAISISDSVRAFVKKRQETLPPGLVMNILSDNTDATRARIGILVKNGIIGFCLVFIILWVFLNTRLAFWVGMGIPFSLAGGIAILWFAGGTINMVSLFTLIMVIGIVADDAIVVGEAVFTHRQSGLPPLKAAVEGVWEMGLPVTAAVVTSIIAYLPLAFIQGIMGKFIAILPITAISCLIVSLMESIVLLPAHLSHLPETHSTQIKYGFIMTRIFQFRLSIGRGLEWFADNIYLPLLHKVLRWRYYCLCFGVSILLLTIGMVRGGILRLELFPDTDGFIISSAVEFPEGTPIEVTEKAVQELRDAIMRINNRSVTKSGDPLIVNLMTTVGNTPDDSPGEVEDDRSQSHLGGVQAILLEAEKRGIPSKDLLVAWEKETGSIYGANALTFFSSDIGPPSEPIEIGIEGGDMDTILVAAHRLMDRLRQFEGVSQVRCDYMTGKDEIRFRLRPEASTLDLKADDIAEQLHASYYGEEAFRIQRGRDDIKVLVKYDRKERNRISSLDQVRIETPAGEKVPLQSLVYPEYGPGKGTITRHNGQKRVTVRADIDDNLIHSDEIIDYLSVIFFQTLQNGYPGIRFAIGGEEEEEADTFRSLIIGFPIAIFGIYLVLAAMFRSYVQPFIILFTIPFGIIGAVAGHLMLGHSLSLLSIFGMVAMSGVVVNDAIVLIERINKNLSQGMAFFEAIKAGCKRRFRAVFLTSISTVVGLAPLIMETNQHAQIIIPMAISMAAGLSFATVLTLFLIPSLLAILSDLRLMLNRIRHGVWQKREEIEPMAYPPVGRLP